MGGKSYYCSYCFCFMKNDINVRKIHNAGLAHVIAKCRYNRKYEDPAIVLAEEISKIPCTKYAKGFCKFDLYCAFSHYNQEELKQLSKIVEKMKHYPSNYNGLVLRKDRAAQKRTRNRIKRNMVPPEIRKINITLPPVAQHLRWFGVPAYTFQ